MIICDATCDDLFAIGELLDRAALPRVDIPEHIAYFIIARTDASSINLIGSAGLEVHAPIGLLRSVAVAPKQRKSGIGTALVAAIETRARVLGLDDLFLLTTTAQRFFERCGYHVYERKKVPADLRSTREFSLLCPASAICMHKRLLA